MGCSVHFSRFPFLVLRLLFRVFRSADLAMHRFEQFALRFEGRAKLLAHSERRHKGSARSVDDGRP